MACCLLGDKPSPKHKWVSEWVSEWLNLTAFLGTEESEVHIVHINPVITAYTQGNYLSIGSLGKKLQWNFNNNIYISCMKMYLNMSSAKYQPFCSGPNV